MRRAIALGACLSLALLCQLSLHAGEVDKEMDEKIRATDRPDAPELDGGSAWINTEKPLTIADLKGKVVLMDFWTFG
ncbi:MAG TPA: hypothetical protein VEK08_01900 [Planctomycetota bacterium]|nr:hypothetical protein [Planctomycetota bacterium]